MHLRDWYDLTRLDHGILWGAAVVVGEILAYRGIPPLQYIILGFAAPLLVEIGVFSLNDYMDRESDILNNRIDRPLVRGAFPRQYPLYIALVMLPGAVVVGFISSLMVPLILVILFSALGVLYNVKLKGVPCVKNCIMGVCIAAPLLGGNLIVEDEILPVVALFATAAFLLGTGREILKDMMDTAGDKATGCRTLPLLIGSKNSARIVFSLFLVSCVVILFPCGYPCDSFYFHDILYLISACITCGLTVYCACSLLKDWSRTRVVLLRKRTFNILELGVFTFLLGVLF
ncbi:MAG: UbiA family prenyltransferase [Theionarchaea archaeon]|nr:UbiA family prenyltransferase [Theionarchaea archaeon]MBU7001331.1 UbiA family prenyltransferase [Theionarchaea archaeon]MBU7019822.1 UbiA family prenyltransferase [Theionarchaea archaeon]MBU7035139.1 UbiA family prenyltransferase [Theionarchaea archaeon]MBU7040754.1 UbiA family prenyltransferase [Theionarchaea archaeon]